MPIFLDQFGDMSSQKRRKVQSPSNVSGGKMDFLNLIFSSS
jgi:hypothetical protein